MTNNRKSRSSAAHISTKKPGIFLPILLIIMSAYPPLSTDMYLPALKGMINVFQTQGSVVNLTLVLFFIFFAFSTLLWGPISDKYGRKPALLAGITLYTLGSIACMLSFSVYQLIAARIIQAIGAAAPVTIAMAIVQDTYTGESKKKMLAVMSALMMVAPVVAPIIGSFILSFSDWRSIFLALTVLGLFSLLGSLFLKESIPFKKDESVLAALKGVSRVISNTTFVKFLLPFSLLALFILGFVGGSSLIFTSGFGVDQKTFTFFFSINAICSICGSILYVPVSRILKTNHMVSLSFLIIGISGLLVIMIGKIAPLLFLLCVVPGTFMAALIRPLSMDLLLDMGGPETGAVAATINFLFNIIGSIGMAIIGLEWQNRATIYGIMVLGVGIYCLLSWSIIQKKLSTEAIEEYRSEA